MKMHRKDWTNEEIEFVILNAHSLSVKEIAEKIGRTEWAVYNKLQAARRNGHKEDLDEVSAHDLANMFGMSLTIIRRWMKKRFFGGFRVMGCTLRGNKSGRKKRFIPRANVIEFVSDPMNGWLLDRTKKIPTDLVDYVTNRFDYYVDVRWISERAYVTPQTVHLWFREGYLPCVRARYNSKNGNPLRVVPVVLAEQHLDLFSAGENLADIRKENIRKARELNGFDNDVRAHWRDPWKYPE